MLKFTFIKNDAKNIILLTFFVFFFCFQVCSASAAPRDAAIVYVTVNIRVVNDNNYFLFKNALALNNIPIFFEILFSMYFICVFQVRFLSSKTPRNFIDSVRAISRLFMFRFGKISGTSSFLLGLSKNEYLFFFSH